MLLWRLRCARWASRPALLLVLKAFHPFCHWIVGVVFAEAVDDSGLVSGASVLARFRFADQARDGNLKADNRAKLLFDVIDRRVGDGPWLRARRLESLGQPRYQTVQPLRVFDDAHRSVGVDDEVVVCRHDLPVFALRLVPGRRDVGLRAAEDGESGRPGIEVLPDRVSPRDMAAQCSEGRRQRVVFEWEMIRREAVRGERYQRAERVVADDLVKDLGAGLFKVSGKVDHAVDDGMTLLARQSPDMRIDVFRKASLKTKDLSEGWESYPTDKASDDPSDGIVRPFPREGKDRAPMKFRCCHLFLL